MKALTTLQDNLTCQNAIWNIALTSYVAILHHVQPITRH